MVVIDDDKPAVIKPQLGPDIIEERLRKFLKMQYSKWKFASTDVKLNSGPQPGNHFIILPDGR